MLRVYLTSVVIYMIIIYCTCSIFRDGIIEKGWGYEGKRNGKMSTLFMLSAVPVLRICVIILIFYMSTHTKEEFDKWYKEVQEKKKQEK